METLYTVCFMTLLNEVTIDHEKVALMQIRLLRDKTSGVGGCGHLCRVPPGVRQLNPTWQATCRTAAGGMRCLPAHLYGAGMPARVLNTRPTCPGGGQVPALEG